MNGEHHTVPRLDQPFTSYSSVPSGVNNSRQDETSFSKRQRAQYGRSSANGKTTVDSGENMEPPNPHNKPLLTGTKKKLYEHVMYNLFLKYVMLNEYV